MNNESEHIFQLATIGSRIAAPSKPPGLSPEQSKRFALEHSIAGRAGHALEPMIAPLGFDWKIGVGLFASLVSLMVFFVFALQCTSTLAVMKRETNSWRWPAFSHLLLLAYGMSFATYRIDSFLGRRRVSAGSRPLRSSHA